MGVAEGVVQEDWKDLGSVWFRRMAANKDTSGLSVEIRNLESESYSEWESHSHSI